MLDNDLLMAATLAAIFHLTLVAALVVFLSWHKPPQRRLAALQQQDPMSNKSKVYIVHWDRFLSVAMNIAEAITTTMFFVTILATRSAQLFSFSTWWQGFDEELSLMDSGQIAIAAWAGNFFALFILRWMVIVITKCDRKTIKSAGFMVHHGLMAGLFFTILEYNELAGYAFALVIPASTAVLRNTTHLHRMGYLTVNLQFNRIFYVVVESVTCTGIFGMYISDVFVREIVDFEPLIFVPAALLYLLMSLFLVAGMMRFCKVCTRDDDMNGLDDPDSPKGKKLESKTGKQNAFLASMRQLSASLGQLEPHTIPYPLPDPAKNREEQDSEKPKELKASLRAAGRAPIRDNQVLDTGVPSPTSGTRPRKTTTVSIGDYCCDSDSGSTSVCLYDSSIEDEEADVMDQRYAGNWTQHRSGECYSTNI